MYLGANCAEYINLIQTEANRRRGGGEKKCWRDIKTRQEIGERRFRNMKNIINTREKREEDISELYRKSS